MNILEISEFLKKTNLQGELAKRIHLFHDLVGLPLTGIDCEGVLYNTLKVLNIEATWQAGSHNSEKDMIIKLGNNSLNTSLKGCKENKLRLNFSSYRTTSAETLDHKLELIEKLDSQLDLILVFGRYHTGKQVFPDYYKIYLINPRYLSPKNYSWKPTMSADSKLTGFHTSRNEYDINMGIVLKMSGQLWVSVNKGNTINYPEMITEVLEIKVAS